MIDSTKSPMPTWRRYGTVAVLAVLIVAAAFLLWTKELHHSSSTNSAPPAPVPVVSHSTARSHVVPSSTTIPGGIEPSGRDPFSS